MEPNSREFALFIDGIRIERGLSREDLIDGIISLSQYKRYLRGVTAIPNNIVLLIADRLKYNITEFYTLYTKKYSTEYNQIKNIYKLIQENNYNEAFFKAREINDELIVSGFNKLFYDYCIIYSQYKLGRISDIHVLSSFSEMINYPNCMENESFNMVEIDILIQIVTISTKMENFGPANELYKKLTSNNLNFSRTDETSILPSLYYTVSRVMYNQNDHEKVVELCDIGVTVALADENSNAIPHLFILKAISLKVLNRLEEAYDSVRRCFMQLIILNKQKLTDAFITSYNSNFDIPLNELMKDVYKLL